MLGKIKGILLGAVTHALMSGASVPAEVIGELIQDVEKVATLGPGEQQNSKVVTLSEFGNHYSVWVVVKRETAAPTT